MTPRETWHELGAEHPGGLCGRFGARRAGEMLLACQAYERAKGRPAREAALEAFRATVARIIQEE